MRLLGSSLSVDEVRPKIHDVVNQLFRDVPSGAGRGGQVRISYKDLESLLAEGAAWMVKHQYGDREDLEHCEESGAIDGADPAAVSDRAKKRGLPQVGTLGSGNHFLEIQYVERIFEPEIAQALGLHENEVVVLIHSGSRGLGHQVCTDYLRDMDEGMRRYGINVPDRQLACVPVHSKEGQSYLGAMRAAANFAWANRQGITHFTRQAFKRIFGEKETLGTIYDVCHNIAKLERHTVDGRERKVMVHRKGATRAFPAGRPEVPEAYKAFGQPVLIPGSMGTASWVLVGAEGAMQETFGTTCHGAGRAMSRTAALRDARGRRVDRELAEQGIVARARSLKGLAEEQPAAYKDVDQVVEVVDKAGISKKVARLRPVGVIKG